MAGSKHTTMRQRWRRWLKRIEVDVYNLVVAQHIYEGIGSIVRSNPEIQRPGDVHDWMSRCYGTAAVIGVRRLDDPDKRSVSLRRLLTDIAANAAAISRESHVCHYGVGRLPDDRARLREAGERWFDSFAGSGKRTLPASVPKRHLRQVKNAAHRIRGVVNKQIAHLDQKNAKRRPLRFEEIHDAIGLIERTVIDYKLLLNAISPQPTLLPTWQYDWERVFYRRWVKSPPPGWRVAD